MLIETPILQYCKYSPRSSTSIGAPDHIGGEILSEVSTFTRKWRCPQILPGTSEDSFLLASSLVRIFSSAVRGAPGGFNFPPGHRFSRKMLRYDISRVSPSKPLTFSLIFLSVSMSDIQDFKAMNNVPLDGPTKNLLKNDHNGLTS